VQIGSAQLAGPRVRWNGFAILHHVGNPAGKRCLPLESPPTRSRTCWPSTNTNGVMVGRGPAKCFGSGRRHFPVVIRDGTIGGGDRQLQEPHLGWRATGHTSFMLSDPVQGFPVYPPIKRGHYRGSIPPAGGQISRASYPISPPPDNHFHFHSHPWPIVGTNGGSIRAPSLSGGDGWGQTTFGTGQCGHQTRRQAPVSCFSRHNGKSVWFPCPFPFSAIRHRPGPRWLPS